MEMALSSKRKLGYINGTVIRDEDGIIKGDMWDTCNDTIIGWIMGSVSKPIKQTIMYIMSAREIWLYLVRRFQSQMALLNTNSIKSCMRPSKDHHQLMNTILCLKVYGKTGVLG